jgi:hypothetical protein
MILARAAAKVPAWTVADHITYDDWAYQEECTGTWSDRSISGSSGGVSGFQSEAQASDAADTLAENLTSCTKTAWRTRPIAQTGAILATKSRRRGPDRAERHLCQGLPGAHNRRAAARRRPLSRDPRAVRPMSGHRSDGIGCPPRSPRFRRGPAILCPNALLTGRSDRLGRLSSLARELVAVGRVSPTPVDIWVGDGWIRGTVRTCEVSEDGQTCSAVVSYGGPSAMTTVRVDAARMRMVSGEPGCPAAHQDATCS